jgi:hypothetical protein
MSESEYVSANSLNPSVTQLVLRVSIATHFARLSCLAQVRLVLLPNVHCASTSAREHVFW